MSRTCVVLMAAAVLTGCCSLPKEAPMTLEIPHETGPFVIDGVLDEVCYREHPPLTAFVVAGDPARTAPSTKAWLFWNETHLVCAFECADTTPADCGPSDNEHDVDGQDRAEIFLWTGDPSAAYHCIEAAPGGAVHDYAARFYRRFDSAWSPGGGWMCHAVRSPRGYSVEMALPKVAIEAMGIRMQACHLFRIGLFRADFDTLNGTPTWITWIDHGRDPDFHVAESFGHARLSPPARKTH